MIRVAQRDAIGDLSHLPRRLAHGLSSRGFRPLSPPGPRDWLAVHSESGQTYEDFIASEPTVPDAKRNMLALVLLGDLPSRAANPGLLRRYAEAFFGMRANVLSGFDPAEAAEHARVGRAGQRQLLTQDVLVLLRRMLPENAFALIAVTREDLYPNQRFNFVFGEASLRERIGVFSFARYDPALSSQPTNDPNLFERRSLNVMVHEIGHMFGLEHCTYFACLMNGSNHLEEADRRPMHLCPVCLRKLQWSAGFDIATRYEALQAIYRELGFDDEAHFTHERIAEIER